MKETSSYKYLWSVYILLPIAVMNQRIAAFMLAICTFSYYWGSQCIFLNRFIFLIINFSLPKNEALARFLVLSSRKKMQPGKQAKEHFNSEFILVIIQRFTMIIYLPSPRIFCFNHLWSKETSDKSTSLKCLLFLLKINQLIKAKWLLFRTIFNNDIISELRTKWNWF